MKGWRSMAVVVFAACVLWIILRINLIRYLREAAFDVRGRAMVLGRIIVHPHQGSLYGCAKDSIITMRTGLGYELVKSYRDMGDMGINVENIYNFVEKRVRGYRIAGVRLETIARAVGCMRELDGRIAEISKGQLFKFREYNVTIGDRQENRRLHGRAALDFEKLNKQYEEILKKTG
jgi:hypothetical protein